MAFKKKLRIAITTGDLDGIGWEVTTKALRAIGPLKGVQFAVFRGARDRQRAPFPAGFKRQVVHSLAQCEGLPFAEKTLLEVSSRRPPARWVEESAAACMQGRFQALVTAPLSKTSIRAAGLKDIGHTEILARVSGHKNLFMGFVGTHFSVVLATAHVPLKRAITDLKPAQIENALLVAHSMRSILRPTKARLPMALVGVNPHAGEQGLIGKEETWMIRLLHRLRLPVAGPLVPDAAFQRANWSRYSVFVVPYHDQGLIPFKMIHGFGRGVHVTLGLPFVRTSVDHGTAKDIFAQNKANAGSMQDAVRTAIRLAKEKMS